MQDIGVDHLWDPFATRRGLDEQKRRLPVDAPIEPCSSAGAAIILHQVSNKRRSDSLCSYMMASTCKYIPQQYAATRLTPNAHINSLSCWQ